jgi:hypothetical protein
MPCLNAAFFCFRLNQVGFAELREPNDDQLDEIYPWNIHI